jgi:hypothetical protein
MYITSVTWLETNSKMSFGEEGILYENPVFEIVYSYAGWSGG